MNTEHKRQINSAMQLMERDLLKAADILTEPDDKTQALLLRPWVAAFATSTALCCRAKSN